MRCGCVLLVYRTWATPLSVIAATRSCGQATRAQPGARRALYSVSEIPSKSPLASQMMLCQEHSLSASLCTCSAPKVDSECGVDVYTYSADKKSCMVSCVNGFSMVGDPAVVGLCDERLLD